MPSEAHLQLEKRHFWSEYTTKQKEEERFSNIHEFRHMQYNEKLVVDPGTVYHQFHYTLPSIATLADIVVEGRDKSDVAIAGALASGNPTFVPLASIRVPIGARIEETMEPQGIMSAFVLVCTRWELSRDEKAQLLGYPPGDPIAEGLMDGGIFATSQDIRERIGYVVGICVALSALFNRELEAELAWLRQTRAQLSGKSPVQFMLQRRMKNLVQVSELLRRERGV